MVEERFELDLCIAQDVRVGRSSGLVFTQKLREHTVLVFRGEIDVFDFDAYDICNRRCIDKIGVG